VRAQLSLIQRRMPRVERNSSSSTEDER
jgi:hypothetical protein